MAQGPKLLGFGALCVAASTVLAWFSSVTTLRLARSETAATLTYETRLLNLITVDQRTFPDVTGVSVIRSRRPGVRSNTPDYLTFESRNGPIDAGYVQQHFSRDYVELDAFFKPGTEPPQPELRLSSIGRGEELRRFVFAQVAVAFLAMMGLGVWWLAVDEISVRRRSVGSSRKSDDLLEPR
jgi:hypothetical protein